MKLFLPSKPGTAGTSYNGEEMRANREIVADEIDSKPHRMSSTPFKLFELESILTPTKGDKFFNIPKGGNLLNFDEDSGLGMDHDVPELSPITSFECHPDRLNGSYDEFQTRASSKTPNSRLRFFDVRRPLFGAKRQALADDMSPVVKRRRAFSARQETSWTKPGLTEKGCQTPSSHSVSIISAVDRLTSEDDLLADGSSSYCLPTVPGKHKDLKSISPETMATLLMGDYSDQIGKATVIDCRYPYEYDGGHISGAVNLYTKKAIEDVLHSPPTPKCAANKRHVLIFHCEFSSERGPKLYRMLRSLDRDLNKSNYPCLKYPEIYLLDGGYKAFYEAHKELCTPMSYKPMLHKDHVDDLRHFRVKSKTWTCGETRPRFHRFGSRQTLMF